MVASSFTDWIITPLGIIVTVVVGFVVMGLLIYLLHYPILKDEDE